MHFTSILGFSHSKIENDLFEKEGNMVHIYFPLQEVVLASTMKSQIFIGTMLVMKWSCYNLQVLLLIKGSGLNMLRAELFIALEVEMG